MKLSRKLATVGHAYRIGWRQMASKNSCNQFYTTCLQQRFEKIQKKFRSYITNSSMKFILHLDRIQSSLSSCVKYTLSWLTALVCLGNWKYPTQWHNWTSSETIRLNFLVTVLFSNFSNFQYKKNSDLQRQHALFDECFFRISNESFRRES